MKISIFDARACRTVMACYCRTIDHDVVLVPKFEEQVDKMTKFQEILIFFQESNFPMAST
jgi:hypothetical protein